MKVVVCCLDGENLVGSHKAPWRIATKWKRTTKLLRQYFRCIAFGYLSVSNSAGCL